MVARLSELYRIVGNYLELHGDKEIESITSWNQEVDAGYTLNLHDISDGTIGANLYRHGDRLNIPEKEELELNDRQIARVDEIHNAVFEMCKVLAENPDLEWDMYYIGGIADYAADMLCQLGNKVRYPAVVTEEDGKQYIQEYYNGIGDKSYSPEKFERVSVFGILCEFGDMRIDRGTVPEGKYVYEVAGDDDGGEEPIKIQPEISYHFIGTLICDEPLPIGEDGVLHVENGDFVWNPPSDEEVHIGQHNIFDNPTGMNHTWAAISRMCQ